eukprot:m.55720 g.55720  ORF g.55720 m.55720 type:complete len:57 (-) comp11511_c0_seq1:309-479(-)
MLLLVLKEADERVTYTLACPLVRSTHHSGVVNETNLSAAAKGTRKKMPCRGQHSAA